MAIAADTLRCRRCGRAVVVSAAQYETFERMHYVCFHYEFEHDPAGPDLECTAGGCPSGALGDGRETAAATAKRLGEHARGSPGWENESLPAFLEALAAWLEDCPGARIPDAKKLASYGKHRRSVQNGRYTLRMIEVHLDFSRHLRGQLMQLLAIRQAEFLIHDKNESPNWPLLFLDAL